MERVDFSETNALKCWKMQTTNCVYEGICVLKVKVISLPYISLVVYDLCFTRPRYQVCVYRTIGPLVYACCSSLLLHSSYCT